MTPEVDDDAENNRPTESLFDDFIRRAKTPASSTTFIFEGELPKYMVKQEFKYLTDQLVDYKREGVIEYSLLDSNENSYCVKINLHEPAFTNYMYTHVSLINGKMIKKWLKQHGRDNKALQFDRTYTCSLIIKNNTTDAFLQWNGGEQLLYHFEGFSSPLYVFFLYLTQHTDILLDINVLKAEKAVKPSVTKLHDLLTKTFVRKKLKEVFVPICEARKLLLKGSVQITGADIIHIIRANLLSIEKDQTRHTKANVIISAKKLVKRFPTLRDSAE